MPLAHYIPSAQLGCQPIRGYDGKIIGQKDSSTFKKTINGSKHLLRKPLAIAIDAYAFEREIAFLQYIEVYDSKTHLLYASTVENFKRHKGELNRGFGRQYFCCLYRFDVDDLSQPRFRQLPLMPLAGVGGAI